MLFDFRELLLDLLALVADALVVVGGGWVVVLIERESVFEHTAPKE